MNRLKNDITPDDRNIENKIYSIRGQQAMLDSDIAELFATDVSQLNRQMKRNKNRFPNDFLFSNKRKRFAKFLGCKM